jgi:hypothetical protein
MRQLRNLKTPGYFVAALFVLFPIYDFFVTVWPLQFGNVRWRVAVAGQIGASVMTMLLGLFLALAVSYVMDQPRVQRALAAVSGLFAAGLLVTLVLFALDWLQLRKDVRPELHHAFDVVSTQAAIKLVLGTIGATLMTLSALRMAREASATSAARRAARGKEAGPLVAGVTTGRGGAQLAP